MCRMLVGTDHRWLLPFSALAGAALLTASERGGVSLNINVNYLSKAPLGGNVVPVVKP